MFALLILPILVSGFIVCNRSRFFYYRLHRYDGQHLYLISAQLGFFCLISAGVLLFILQLTIPYKVELLSHTLSIAPITSLAKSTKELLGGGKQLETMLELFWLTALSITSVLIAYLWWLISASRLWIIDFIKITTPNFLGNTCKIPFFLSDEATIPTAAARLMYPLLKDSPLDQRLLESLTLQKPVLLTLDTNKVYVGLVSKLGEPNESEGPNQEIAIVPILSGYRCKDKQQVHVYPLGEGSEDEDLSIVIPQERIVSISWFLKTVHERVLKERLKEKNKDKDKDKYKPKMTRFTF